VRLGDRASGLGPGVKTARTLFSDTQEMLVARVLNNSVKDKSLSANSFLSIAEPVQCLSSTDCHTSGLVFAERGDLCDSGLLDESFLSATPGCLSAMVTTDATDANAITYQLALQFACRAYF